MSIYVGLDCGGSSSRVLAVDESGNIVFQGQSGAANLVSTPDQRLRRNLQHATRGCASANFVCGCFAGLVSDETRTKGEDLLKQMFPGSTVRAEPDYTAAFYSSPQDTDICVIAGTGSLVCSKGLDGRMTKSGGRGYVLGDFGSGFHYGRDALVHYLDHPKTCSSNLRHAVHDLFGTDQEGQIIAAVYASGPPQILARLAKVLGTDAKDGEVYALQSINRNGSALVDVVCEHVHRYLKPAQTLNISLAGGIWKASPIYKDRFQELLIARYPERQVIVHRLTKPPLYGAVELAKELGIGN